MKIRIRNLCCVVSVLFGLSPAARLHAQMIPTQSLHFYQIGESRLNSDTTLSLASKFGIKALPKSALSTNLLAAFGEVGTTHSVRMGLFLDRTKYNPTLFLHPRLDILRTPAMSQNAAFTKATDFLRTHSLLVSDGSRFVVGEQHTWTTQTANVTGTGSIGNGQTVSVTNPLDIIRTVTVRRTLDGIPVYGNANIWKVDVGATDVVGFTVSARPASRLALIPAIKTQSQLDQEFELQVQQFYGKTLVSSTATPIYFEQGKNYIQPAMMYSVVLNADPALTGTTGLQMATTIIIPLATNCPEFINPNADTIDRSPIFASEPGLRTNRVTMGDPTSIKIGEYIIRNDDSHWLLDAQKFWAVLSGYNSTSGHPPYVRRDYYWDVDWLWENTASYTGESQWYQGQDHFVLMEGHGAPWEFSTYMSGSDIVHLQNVPGFGKNQNASEVTAYIQFQSCDVIPEPGHAFGGDFNSGSAWDVWWHLFKGMHACVGYRTLMHIANDVSSGFAARLGMGCSVVPAWLDATNSGPYGHTNGWNYANAVFVTGHEEDRITDVTQLANPSSLTMVWCHP